QAVIAAVDTQPEAVARTLTPGDTISIETLAWPYDIDRFNFTASTTDTVIFEVTRPLSDTAWTRTVYARDDRTGAAVFDMPLLWVGNSNVVPRVDFTPGRSVTLSLDGWNR